MGMVADNSDTNKMTVRNLAIVLTPSVFPIHDMLTPPANPKERRNIDPNSQAMLSINTVIVEALIKNADKVGLLPSSLAERYKTGLSLPSYSANSQSEDNLDNENEGLAPSQR